MSTTTIYQQFARKLGLHGYSFRTISGYVRQVSALVWHYQRQPEEITPAELREFLLHLVFERRYSRAQMITAISALRAFLWLVLRHSEEAIRGIVPTLYSLKSKPEICTPEEVERLLGA